MMANERKLGAELDYDLGWDIWDDMKRYGPMSSHTRRLIWNMVKQLQFKSVLDVGCGQGSPLEEIARHKPGLRLAGVDISQRAVDLAAPRLPQADFSVLDLTKESLDEKFDLIVCTDVLEHIPDDRAALSNMRKMANRWCLVSTIQGRMRPFEREVGHVRNYKRGELAAKMEQAGFKVRRQLDWGFPLYSPLYREACQIFPTSTAMGKFGFKRKLFARALYYLFFANLPVWGDYVIILGEAK